jgi:hypothetical protein
MQELTAFICSWPFSAIALRAAFLGTGAVQVFAQVLQDGLRRGGARDFAQLALEIETDGL